jgi:hypothetical protein
MEFQEADPRAVEREGAKSPPAGDQSSGGVRSSRKRKWRTINRGNVDAQIQSMRKSGRFATATLAALAI